MAASLFTRTPIAALALALSRFLVNNSPAGRSQRAAAYTMFGIPRRYSHFVFGVIQSGLTTVIATFIASFPEPTLARFLTHWMLSWLIAWAAMLPVVMLAAPGIRALTFALTRDETRH